MIYVKKPDGTEYHAVRTILGLMLIRIGGIFDKILNETK